MSTFYPIISMDDNPDDRAEGVILLEESEGWKETVQDKGDYWLLVEWEVYRAPDLTATPGELFWFERSTSTISKALVQKLAATAEGKQA